MKELCAVSKECKGVCRTEREENRKKSTDTCPAWYMEKSRRKNAYTSNQEDRGFV